MLVLFCRSAPLLLATWLTQATCSPAPTIPSTPQTSSAFVNLGYAAYQGNKLGNDINEFLGLRFAKPPLGDLRWRKPVEPVVTTGVQDATKAGAICAGIGANPGSEDCLFVNVYSPAHAKPASKLPVWVFIQGGGYAVNSQPNYNGSKVIETSGNNIIFVNFNWRVGAFGFLASEKIKKNGELNVGLLDQRAALEWVQKYIALFGGDPSKVTIHGASAGAGSTAHHLAAYGGRNDQLFSAAIAESLDMPWLPAYSELEFQFDAITNATGCSTSADPVTCLRGLDFATLEAANVARPFPNRTGPTLSPYVPCVDGDMVQESPLKAFAKGKFIKVPIIFGNDNDEGNYFTSAFATYLGYAFATPADVASFLVDNFPHLTPADTDFINSLYPLAPPIASFGAYFPSVSSALGEVALVCPAISILQFASKFFSPDKVWSYRYNVLDDGNVAAGLGVPHVFETTAIFGWGMDNNNVLSYTTYNADIVPVVMNYWISFVRTHDPNVFKYQGSPSWDSYGTQQKRIVLQTNATKMENVPSAQLKRCDVWKGLWDDTEQ